LAIKSLAEFVIRTVASKVRGIVMRRQEGNGLACVAPNSSKFLALGADDFSGEFSGDGIRLCLAGDIQIDDDQLLNANGPSKESIVSILSHRYRAMGEGFLRHLQGSFRLALWDSEKQKLLVAVDQFATRPLYYCYAKGVLVFAPRISCFSTLTEIAKEVDPNVVYFYLNHSFIPAPFTIFREIRRLEPGHYLRWQDGCITVSSYWDIQYDEDRSMTANAASALIRSTVEKSVRSYLGAQSCGMHEIGAFLSGGTDSSTLVGLMTGVTGAQTRTFSVGFEEERYNEIHYARTAAFHFNAKAYEYFVSADNALAILPSLAAYFDEPFGNSSAIPTYFCLRMAKEAGIRVMFAGDGGDELFAGNERYLAEKYFLPFDILPTALQNISSHIATFFPGLYSLRKIRRYIERASEPNPKRFFHYQLFLREHADDFFTENFMTNLDRDFPLAIPQQHYQKVIAAAPLNRLLYMDLKMCIADNDLFKVNRMAEALDVKVCYPYLDRGLAEITGKIPVSLKLKGFQKRYIFKRAFAKLLPEEILRKKKHGFGLPIAHWLRTHVGFREMARSLLFDPSALGRDYFNRNGLEKLVRQHDEERSDFYGTFIWNLMMLELWHRNHKDKLHGGSAGQPFALPS
jgi:asparagine synthase (glutamine-hydrolysing)